MLCSNLKKNPSWLLLRLHWGQQSQWWVARCVCQNSLRLVTSGGLILFPQDHIIHSHTRIKVPFLPLRFWNMTGAPWSSGFRINSMPISSPSDSSAASSSSTKLICSSALMPVLFSLGRDRSPLAYLWMKHVLQDSTKCPCPQRRHRVLAHGHFSLFGNSSADFWTWSDTVLVFEGSHILSTVTNPIPWHWLWFWGKRVVAKISLHL